MEIEQLPPNEPRFGLIVVLFAVAILVVFVIAYFTLDWDGKRLVPHHHVAHPTSELVMPGGFVADWNKAYPRGQVVSDDSLVIRGWKRVHTPGAEAPLFPWPYEAQG